MNQIWQSGSSCPTFIPAILNFFSNLDGIYYSSIDKNSIDLCNGVLPIRYSCIAFI